MKVGGPGRLQSTGVRAGGARKAAGGFQVDGPQKGAKPGGPQAASAVASVGALIALQGTEDATTGRRKAVKRGHALLDALSEIRLALLSGGIPADRLRALLAALEEEASAVSDPRLLEVLDEVELRARVELAKYEQHL